MKAYLIAEMLNEAKHSRPRWVVAISKDQARSIAASQWGMSRRHLTILKTIDHDWCFKEAI